MSLGTDLGNKSGTWHCSVVRTIWNPALSWQVLSRGPSGGRIARSCHHTGPDLTVRIGVKDRIEKLLLSHYVLGFWALSNHDCMP